MAKTGKSLKVRPASARVTIPLGNSADSQVEPPFTVVVHDATLEELILPELDPQTYAFAYTVDPNDPSPDTFVPGGVRYDPETIPELREYVETKGVVEEARDLQNQATQAYRQAVNDMLALDDDRLTARHEAVLELGEQYTPTLWQQHQDAQQQLATYASELEALTQASGAESNPDFARLETEAETMGIALTEHPEYISWDLGQLEQRQQWGRATHGQLEATNQASSIYQRIEDLVEDHLDEHPSYVAADQAYLAARDRAEQVSEAEGMAARLTRTTWAQLERIWGRVDQALGGPGVHTTYDHPERFARTSNNVFQRPMQTSDYMRLTLAQPGDTLTFEPLDSTTLRVKLEGPNSHFASLTFQRDLYTLTIVEPNIRNSGPRTPSSAMDIIDGFETFREYGVTEILARAERSTTHNGYHTWAILGATGDIPNSVIGLVQQEFGPNVWRVEQLMSLRNGPGFWKRWGEPWIATFDLTPGSHTMNRINRYLQRRQRQGGDNS